MCCVPRTQNWPIKITILHMQLKQNTLFRSAFPPPPLFQVSAEPEGSNFVYQGFIKAKDYGPFGLQRLGMSSPVCVKSPICMSCNSFFRLCNLHFHDTMEAFYLRTTMTMLRRQIDEYRSGHVSKFCPSVIRQRPGPSVRHHQSVMIPSRTKTVMSVRHSIIGILNALPCLH